MYLCALAVHISETQSGDLVWADAEQQDERSREPGCWSSLEVGREDAVQESEAFGRVEPGDGESCSRHSGDLEPGT